MTESRASRRHLVVVRAGPASLHRHWLDLPDTARDFDLIVSYYDADAHAGHSATAGVTALLQPGGKWDGLSATLQGLGPALDAYDFIWLPDDDIATDAATINALFAAMRRHDLAVAQPALTPDSYFTHALYLQCPGLALRRTNAVEIMVPCLSRDLLRAVLPLFADTMSGFGLDYIWCRLPQAGGRGGAIVDALAVRHTRPVGKVLAAAMARGGVTAEAERARLNARYGVTERVTPLVFAVQTSDGRYIAGQRRCGFVMAQRYLRGLLTIPAAARRYGLGKVVQLFRRQFTRPLDLSPLAAHSAPEAGATAGPAA